MGRLFLLAFAAVSYGCCQSLVLAAFQQPVLASQAAKKCQAIAFPLDYVQPRTVGYLLSIEDLAHFSDLDYWRKRLIHIRDSGHRWLVISLGAKGWNAVQGREYNVHQINLISLLARYSDELGLEIYIELPMPSFARLSMYTDSSPRASQFWTRLSSRILDSALTIRSSLKPYKSLAGWYLRLDLQPSIQDPVEVAAITDQLNEVTHSLNKLDAELLVIASSAMRSKSIGADATMQWWRVVLSELWFDVLVLDVTQSLFASRHLGDYLQAIDIVKRVSDLTEQEAWFLVGCEPQ